MVRNLPANEGDIRDMNLIPGLGKYPPWRRAEPPILVFLTGEFHGQKSLEGYGLLGLTGSSESSDMTEAT